MRLFVDDEGVDVETISERHRTLIVRLCFRLLCTGHPYDSLQPYRTIDIYTNAP